MSRVLGRVVLSVTPVPLLLTFLVPTAHSQALRSPATSDWVSNHGVKLHYLALSASRRSSTSTPLWMAVRPSTSCKQSTPLRARERHKMSLQWKRRASGTNGISMDSGVRPWRRTFGGTSERHRRYSSRLEFRSAHNRIGRSRMRVCGRLP